MRSPKNPIDKEHKESTVGYPSTRSLCNPEELLYIGRDKNWGRIYKRKKIYEKTYCFERGEDLRLYIPCKFFVMCLKKLSRLLT